MSRESIKIKLLLVRISIESLVFLILSFNIGCSQAEESVSDPVGSRAETTSKPANPASNNLLADIISPEMAAQLPHLKPVIGNTILGNQYYQFVVAGAGARSAPNSGWTPFIIQAFVFSPEKRWESFDCIRSLEFRRNWTDRPLITELSAVIPNQSVERGLAYLDIVYQVAPSGKAKREFFRLSLRDHDPRLFIIADHTEFEKNRSAMEARLSFRSFLGSNEYFSTGSTKPTDPRVSSFSFACKGADLNIQGTAPFKAKLQADNMFEFSTPGRNNKGWDGLFLSMSRDQASQMHLSSFVNKQCPPTAQPSIEASLSAYASCPASLNLPQITLHRPTDDPGVAERCLWMEDLDKLKLGKTCFEQGSTTLVVPVVPEQTFRFVDSQSGQTWGLETPFKLSAGAKEDLHLPNAAAKAAP